MWRCSIIAAAMTTSPQNQPGYENDGSHDLFLSYSSRDREVVVRVRELLRQRSIKIFFDRDNLMPGTPWQSELEKALSYMPGTPTRPRGQA